MKQAMELQKAQNLICESCLLLEGERVSLSESAGRFPETELSAREALPGYDQSLRDGYAIGKNGLSNTCFFPKTFQVVDEVAAGDTRELSLQDGEAIRVMTGGLIPALCTAVVPEESCSVSGRILTVPSSPQKDFIHRAGSVLVKGQRILPPGLPISAENVILLSGVGYTTVQVVRKPRVSFFCTGSELVTGGDEKRAGKKFSANNSLLHILIEQAGAEFQEQQKVVDNSELVIDTMLELLEKEPDILISTGGMGPGKFDLIEDSFHRAGGEIVYHSIRLRPGKATLFGMLGKTLFFGLPGPPPAVSSLFTELIQPAILSFQGARHCGPVRHEALLTEDLFLHKSTLPHLKGGVLSFDGGRLLVREVRGGERVNCSIYCPESCEKLSAGELVTLHLSPFSSFFVP